MRSNFAIIGAVRARMRLALLALIASQTPVFALSPAREAGDCSLENTAPAKIVGLGDDLSFTLDDGRRVALSGLDFPSSAQSEARAAAARRLAGWVVGRTVFVGGFSTGLSRWSRLPARIFADGDASKDAPLVSVGAALLEEGLARYAPDPVALPCAADYVAAEAVARGNGRGLWAEGGFKPVAASARDALLGRRGMTVVEGEIRSAGQTERDIYLNFDDKKLKGFAVVISRRNLAMFAAAGIDPLKLIGRRARVRGLIETGLGPRIEISSPAEIELIGLPPR